MTMGSDGLFTGTALLNKGEGYGFRYTDAAKTLWERMSINDTCTYVRQPGQLNQNGYRLITVPADLVANTQALPVVSLGECSRLESFACADEAGPIAEFAGKTCEYLRNLKTNGVKKGGNADTNEYITNTHCRGVLARADFLSVKRSDYDAILGKCGLTCYPYCQAPPTMPPMPAAPPLPPRMPLASPPPPSPSIMLTPSAPQRRARSVPRRQVFFLETQCCATENADLALSKMRSLSNQLRDLDPPYICPLRQVFVFPWMYYTTFEIDIVSPSSQRLIYTLGGGTCYVNLCSSLSDPEDKDIDIYMRFIGTGDYKASWGAEPRFYSYVFYQQPDGSFENMYRVPSSGYDAPWGPISLAEGETYQGVRVQTSIASGTTDVYAAAGTDRTQPGTRHLLDRLAERLRHRGHAGRVRRAPHHGLAHDGAPAGRRL